MGTAIDTVTITATAPGRCGIVGNPTDMYGGTVISISTVEQARCVLRPSTHLLVTTSEESAIFRGPDDLELRGDTLDIARAVLGYLGVEPRPAGFSLSLLTEIPMKAGMAGSTALVVAVLGVVSRRLGIVLHPWAMAEMARKVEAHGLRLLCGLQDHHMAVFGGLNYMDFRGKEMLEQRDDEPLAVVEPLHTHIADVPLLVAHTGIQHHSGSVHTPPRQRWLNGEREVVDAYVRAAELARLGKRALLARDWRALGELMNENHAIVARLGGSGEANDRLIDAAREAGAYGAKLAGAGGGGTVIVLTDDPNRVAEALVGAGADRLMTPRPSPGLRVEVGG